MTRLEVLKALKEGKVLSIDGFMSKTKISLRVDTIIAVNNSILGAAGGPVNIDEFFGDENDFERNVGEYEISKDTKYYEEVIAEIVSLVEHEENMTEAQKGDLHRIKGAIAAIDEEINALEAKSVQKKGCTGNCATCSHCRH